MKIVDVLKTMKVNGVQEDMIFKKREKLINKLNENLSYDDQTKLVNTVDAAYKNVFPNYKLNKVPDGMEEVITPGAAKESNAKDSEIQNLQQCVINIAKEGAHSLMVNQQTCMNLHPNHPNPLMKCLDAFSSINFSSNLKRSSKELWGKSPECFLKVASVRNFS